VLSEPLLKLDGVVKRFGGLVALDGVSFSVAPSEIVGLVGPNGSGKTTAINIISGTYHADAGSVLFEGARIDRVPAFRRVPLGINRTFQVPKPFAAMTVRENIAVAAYFGARADLLLRLAARGIALIVVEHVLDFLNRIANRVIVLSAGRMLFEGRLEDASRNADVVAAFIGG